MIVLLMIVGGLRVVSTSLFHNETAAAAPTLRRTVHAPPQPSARPHAHAHAGSVTSVGALPGRWCEGSGAGAREGLNKKAKTRKVARRNNRWDKKLDLMIERRLRPAVSFPSRVSFDKLRVLYLHRLAHGVRRGCSRILQVRASGPGAWSICGTRPTLPPPRTSAQGARAWPGTAACGAAT